MKSFAKASRVATVAGLFLLFSPVIGRGDESLEVTAAETILRLEDLEQMALESNPTIAQGSAQVRAAEGRRLQAGLYPNPTVGYVTEEFSARNPSARSQHYFFVSQRLVTAGKLAKSRSIFAREQTQAEAEKEEQKQRVLNAVRMLYDEALGAERLVEMRRELARIAREAVGISGELYNIGQADRPDLLEAEIESERANLDLVNAENDRELVWRLLATVVGNPELRPTLLDGDIEGETPTLDQEKALTRLLGESPEMKVARAMVERAKAALERARAEPIPDILLRAGFGYNLDAREPQGFLELGVPLPLFDRNQGNIAAARAELTRAEEEMRRLELALRSLLASTFRDYQNSLAAAERYRTGIIPRAQKGYDLYLARFREMAAAYPQVIIAQRTLFQARADYIQALITLHRSVTAIAGMLLTGGLTPPGEALPEKGITAGAVSGIRAGTDGAGLVEKR